MVKIKYAWPKIFASRLVGSRGPKMAHGPQFGNHWCTDKHEVQWNRHSSFSNIKLFLNILHVWLENACLCPQIGVFGDFTPYMGSSIYETPKRHILTLPQCTPFEPSSTKVRWQVWPKNTHTRRTHPFNGPFSGTTRVSRYQKGKTNLDFTVARDSVWQWHHLGHMQVCTLAPDR